MLTTRDRTSGIPECRNENYQTMASSRFLVSCLKKLMFDNLSLHFCQKLKILLLCTFVICGIVFSLCKFACFLSLILYANEACFLKRDYSG